MQRLLPRLNHLDGLHVAGDYINGYGHEARSLLGVPALVVPQLTTLASWG